MLGRSLDAEHDGAALPRWLRQGYLVAQFDARALALADFAAIDKSPVAAEVFHLQQLLTFFVSHFDTAVLTANVGMRLWKDQVAAGLPADAE